jgi:hypothetical protein
VGVVATGRLIPLEVGDIEIEVAKSIAQMTENARAAA